MTTTMRGADIVAHTLAAAGVEHVFSLSGNHIMSVYDAALDVGLNIYHVRHEAGAVHMADAYARLTGKVGIALLTGGPGHANGVAALYTARESESPVVLLSGHAPLGQLGSGAFQEMRQSDLAEPLTKASWTVQSLDTLADDISQAIRIAMGGRPGPVHLSLPDDVLEAITETPEIPGSDAFVEHQSPFPEAIATELAQALRQSKRPLILAGPYAGTAAAGDMLARLRKASGIPTLMMESPRGINDPVLGAFAEVVGKADCVLLLGKRPDHTLGFVRPPTLATDCRLLQVDPDALALDRLRAQAGHFACLPRQFQGDVAAAADALVRALPEPHPADEWRREVEQATRFRPAEWAQAQGSAEGRMHPAEICLVANALVQQLPNAIVVSDGGEFGQWVQGCMDAPRRVINGVAGAIGAGLPFALAARVADPTAMVVMLTGDGSIGFQIGEFDTAVRHGLPFIAIVGNDACWNAEHQIQLRRYGKERAKGCELLPTRYDQVAIAFGGHGEQVEDATALKAALERAKASGKPSCINALMDNVAAPVIRRD